MSQQDTQAIVSTPTPIPKRPRLYLLLVPAEDEWRVRLYSSEPEILVHMDRLKTPGSIIVTIPGDPPPTSTVEPKGECPEGLSGSMYLAHTALSAAGLPVDGPHFYEVRGRVEDAINGVNKLWRSHCNSLLAQIKASKEPAQPVPSIQSGQESINLTQTDSSPPTPEKERGLKP